MTNFSAVKMSAYLMNTAREFRLKLKSAASFGNKKGQSASKATHATVYVAKSYPLWQSTVIGVIKEFNDAGNVSDNKAISQVGHSTKEPLATVLGKDGHLSGGSFNHGNLCYSIR